MAESTPSTSLGVASITPARDASLPACSRIRSTSRAAGQVTADSAHTERSFCPSTLATPGIATVEDNSGSGSGLFSPLQSVNLDRKRLSGNNTSGGVFAPTKFSRSRSWKAANANAAKVGLWGHRRAIRNATIAVVAVTGIAWLGLIPPPSSSIYGSQDSGGTPLLLSPAGSAKTGIHLATMADTSHSGVSGGFRYEVFGKVQGVFFRKYTQEEANRMGLAGWVRNTDRSSVEGEVAGTAGQSQELAQMRHWLGKVGSPKSGIERADFVPLAEERVQELLGMKEFVVRKTKER